MKNRVHFLRNLVAGILVISGSGSLRATDILEVTPSSGIPVIQMELVQASLVPVEVILTDRKEQVLYRNEILPESSFEGSFDFTGLNPGTYRLVSRKGQLEYTRILEVKDSRVSVAESFYTVKPQIVMEEDRLIVKYVNQGRGPLDISIESSNGFEFQRGYVSTEPVYQKAFSLKGMERGYYTLYLRGYDDLHRFDFSID